jgi:hypothetical protein
MAGRHAPGQRLGEALADQRDQHDGNRRFERRERQRRVQRCPLATAELVD